MNECRKEIRIPTIATQLHINVLMEILRYKILLMRHNIMEQFHDQKIRNE